MNINSITISGNLTGDAELRQTSSGKSVLTYCVAINDRQKINGNWQDVPYFINCVQFGAVDKLASMLSKGTKVCVNGKLQISEYEKDGIKRKNPQIVVFALDINSFKTGESKTPSTTNSESTYNEDTPF